MWTDPSSLLVGGIAVIILGLSKGGFSSLGGLATPLFALAVPPATAAAVLLPILIVQDAVSVWHFRHEWDRWVVGWMAPGALLGIVLGWAFAAVLPVRAWMIALGLITLAFGLWRLWLERGGREVAARQPRGWVGSLFGIATGFTSQVAHAGGPPFQMWVMPQRLPHLRYVGTNAILFAMINWAKVPAYFGLGQLTPHNLLLSAAFIPLAIASTFAGVWLVRRIDPARFYTLIYVLMVLLGLKLFWDGVVGA